MHELKTDHVANVKCLIRMAKFLIDSEERDTASGFQCRRMLLEALDIMCTKFAEFNGYSVEIHERTLYWKVDFLSDKTPQYKPLVLLYNASHPDIDWGRVMLNNGLTYKAFELFDIYYDWVSDLVPYLEEVCDSCCR